MYVLCGNFGYIHGMGECCHLLSTHMIRFYIMSHDCVHLAGHQSEGHLALLGHCNIAFWNCQGLGLLPGLVIYLVVIAAALC